MYLLTYIAAIVPVVMWFCQSVIALVSCLDWVFVSATHNSKRKFSFQLLHFLSG